MSPKMSTIQQNVRRIRRALGLSQKQVVRQMQELKDNPMNQELYKEANVVNDTSLSKFERGEINLEPANLQLLAGALETTLDALGDENRLDQGSGKVISMPYHNAIVVRDYTIRNIPFVPVRARATFAENYHTDMQLAEYPIFPLVTTPGEEDYKEPLVIEIDGDSMEPTLRSGWKVLITPENQADWEYMRPGIIAIVYRNYFVVKRVLRNTLPETGLLELLSDNPNGGTATVRMDDIRAIWRIRRIVDAAIDLG